MTAAENINVLPIWVWLIFTILLVGVIAFIYTQGNWRTTLTSTGAVISLCLIISGIYVWNEYLSTHFIGQFDQLGIPFRKAGPGWSLLLDTWPLWCVPIGIIVILAVGADWLLRRTHIVNQVSQPKMEQQIVEPLQPIDNVAKKIELETLKREFAAARERLATTIELAETEMDKRQQLEIKLDQLKRLQEQDAEELQDKITALSLDLAAKDSQNEQLSALTFQQAAEVYRLKDKLAKLGHPNS